MEYREIYNQWCTDPYFDAETKAELAQIRGDEEEIEDRFYRQLEFGTGGLRGVIGAGDEPHEHLHRAPGDPGAGQLYHIPGRAGEGGCHRV